MRGIYADAWRHAKPAYSAEPTSRVFFSNTFLSRLRTVDARHGRRRACVQSGTFGQFARQRRFGGRGVGRRRRGGCRDDGRCRRARSGVDVVLSSDGIGTVPSWRGAMARHTKMPINNAMPMTRRIGSKRECLPSAPRRFAAALRAATVGKAMPGAAAPRWSRSLSMTRSTSASMSCRRGWRRGTTARLGAEAPAGHQDAARGRLVEHRAEQFVHFRQLHFHGVPVLALDDHRLVAAMQAEVEAAAEVFQRRRRRVVFHSPTLVAVVLGEQVLEIMPAQASECVRAGGRSLSRRKHRSSCPCQG